MNHQVSTIRHSVHRHLLAGTALLTILCGAVGAWAATTQIAGAVIATGVLTVDNNVQKIQHQTGGIVGEIRARDGDHVKQGDIVVRLDETIPRANLAIVSKGLDELTARHARLEAERDATKAIVFPSDFLVRMGDPHVAALGAAEQRLFELRRTVRDGLKSRLAQRIGQTQEEIGGLIAQASSKSREITLIEKELAGARELWEKNLIPISKLTFLEREAARLDGERAQLVASAAQAKGKVTELELQILQVDKDLAEEVGKELREVGAKIGELVERKIAATDQLKRIDIQAPQDGIIHQSTVHTVGGVIAPGETIMLVVPSSDDLTVEAKIAAHDIDQVKVGQGAMLRFSALHRTTPEVAGAVSRVSADAVLDPRTHSSHYTVRISIARGELARLGEVRLTPGMPVEVFIQTEYRTVLSYLVKPLQDQISRAFRER